LKSQLPLLLGEDGAALSVSKWEVERVVWVDDSKIKVFSS